MIHKKKQHRYYWLRCHLVVVKLSMLVNLTDLFVYEIRMMALKWWCDEVLFRTSVHFFLAFPLVQSKYANRNAFGNVCNMNVSHWWRMWLFPSGLKLKKKKKYVKRQIANSTNGTYTADNQQQIGQKAVIETNVVIMQIFFLSRQNTMAIVFSGLIFS